MGQLIYRPQDSFSPKKWFATNTREIRAAPGTRNLRDRSLIVIREELGRSNDCEADDVTRTSIEHSGIVASLCAKSNILCVRFRRPDALRCSSEHRIKIQLHAYPS